MLNSSMEPAHHDRFSNPSPSLQNAILQHGTSKSGQVLKPISEPLDAILQHGTSTSRRILKSISEPLECYTPAWNHCITADSHTTQPSFLDADLLCLVSIILGRTYLFILITDKLIIHPIKIIYHATGFIFHRIIDQMFSDMLQATKNQALKSQVQNVRQVAIIFMDNMNIKSAGGSLKGFYLSK